MARSDIVSAAKGLYSFLASNRVERLCQPINDSYEFREQPDHRSIWLAAIVAQLGGSSNTSVDLLAGSKTVFYYPVLYPNQT